MKRKWILDAKKKKHFSKSAKLLSENVIIEKSVANIQTERLVVQQQTRRYRYNIIALCVPLQSFDKMLACLKGCSCISHLFLYFASWPQSKPKEGLVSWPCCRGCGQPLWFSTPSWIYRVEYIENFLHGHPDWALAPSQFPFFFMFLCCYTPDLKSKWNNLTASFESIYCIGEIIFNYNAH